MLVFTSNRKNQFFFWFLCFSLFWKRFVCSLLSVHFLETISLFLCFLSLYEVYIYTEYVFFFCLQESWSSEIARHPYLRSENMLFIVFLKSIGYPLFDYFVAQSDQKGRTRTMR